MECEKFPGKTGATSEGRVGGDGDGGDAHDDVRHGHVDQVQPRVDPQLLGSNSSENWEHSFQLTQFSFTDFCVFQIYMNHPLDSITQGK